SRAWRVSAKRMDSLGCETGLFQEFTAAARGRIFVLIDNSGRQFPREAFQRRPVLANNGYTAIGQRSNNGDVIPLSDRVIQLTFSIGRELPFPLNDRHPW